MTQSGFSALLLACGLVSQLGLACAPTETGNPPLGSVQLGLTAFSTSPDVAAVKSAQGGLVVDQLRVNAVALSLLPCASSSPALDAPADNYDVIASGDANELRGDVRLCGARLELGPSDAPPGAAIFVHGLRTDGTPFEVVSTAARTLELRAPPGASFGAHPLLLAFDIGVWFSTIDVHGAHAGPDGVARLDATLNPTLLATFDAQTSLSVALYADENENGKLDDTELTPVASAP